ncbi:hypothetical protein HORIV_30590 [Vreelandella olivaria]|uniref:4Fe-4S ferredoxin-type domain-containing protein n=1 Tax=Vreelandella olivaria TaxID=390919 RepID=A0ABM7GJ27_9GAMM|nr:hypothetical protein HORIV_30590 [Halomonas olivaria]
MVQGGPMMGTPLSTLDTPVTKLTNCLIAATREEFPPAPAESPCIRCGECESVCPVALLPQQLHWYARAQEDTKLERYHLFDCIECGACSYVCPSHIPLVVDYREAKAGYACSELKPQKPNTPNTASNFAKRGSPVKKPRNRHAGKPVRRNNAALPTRPSPAVSKSTCVAYGLPMLRLKHRSKG